MVNAAIPVTHTRCLGIAFYLTERPYAGDIARASIVRLLDGSTPNDGDVIRCGHCGQPSLGNSLVEFQVVGGFRRGAEA